ncbi:uncharacterized protein LOC131932187 isoform X2 [Physella acuta]|uniref:uncharacterized protein LOC131932187 isoform X2 n=1 Tax=Physella acuta TaxID=109671 RepID=UPI0027DB7DE7|nr:uncharacterized protein LOC131932187 isoform X2 [Physella acuta]
MIITTNQALILRDVDGQHQDDHRSGGTAYQMPPQNLNTPTQQQQQHPDQHQMSQSLVDQHTGVSMADQHSSLDHAHSMAEHAAHSMLDLSETGSSLEHLAGGGHSAQSLADLGRGSDQSLDSNARRQQLHDRIGLNDGGQGMRQLGNDRDIGMGSGNNNGMRPMSGLGDRINQPMRNMTPVGDSRVQHLGNSMSSDGRGSVGLSGGNGNGLSDQGYPEQSSQSLLDSMSSRGRPPSMGGGGQHNLDQQHGGHSLPPHMRGEHPSHSHPGLVDHHSQQAMGGDSSNHNGRGGMSAYGLDNNNGQLHSRPGSTLLQEPNSRNDARDLSRAVYSSSSSSTDRSSGHQSTSLIEETIAAVASNLNKSSPDGGLMPGPLPPNSMMGHLGALGLARSNSAAPHMGHGSDESLADLVGRHHSHGIPMLSERASQSLSGLMDDHSIGASSSGHGQGRELEKTHPCLTCLKMFRSKQQLAQHNLVHTGVRKHICSFCDRAFKQLSHLQQHVRIHTGERKYMCKFCERGFKQLSHLQKHTRIHTGDTAPPSDDDQKHANVPATRQQDISRERKYICSLCDKGFKQLSHLQQHFRIHTDERKYICSCCERGFKQLSHLQQHFRIHTGERKYVCQICNRAFKQMTHLQQHHIIHTGERKYICQVCNRAFKQMTHLQQHHRIHTGERKYVCQICNRAFKQLTHLQKHHVIHTGERKYECQVCNRAFKQMTHLQQHHKIHTGERKYICQCCDRGFKQLTHLQQHYRIHTGEKPYRCKFENCERAFAQLSNLQHHMRNHDDQVKKEATRIHKCQICHRCYTNESSLKSHTLKMHIHIKPIDQHPLPTPKKRRKRKNKDLYGGAPTMVPVSSSSDGNFNNVMQGMKAGGSRTRSPTSSDDDEIIFVGEQMGPPRVDNFGGPGGGLGGQGQMLQGPGGRGHDLSHQLQFTGMGNFSRGADPLALLASANRFTLQDNMMSSLGGPLNSFSDQLAFRDAALLNSRFGDLRGVPGQGSSFDDRFSSGNFNQQQQQQQRDRDGFGNHNDINSRANSASNSDSNMQAQNGNANENRNQIPAHNQGMIRGSGMGGLGGSLGGMMHGSGQGGLGGLMKQIKQEPLDYFPSSCHGGDQFSGMGVNSGGGFLSPQHLINSHLRGQLPSLNVPLIRDHFSQHQMLPHSSASPVTSSTSVTNVAPSSTPSSLPSSTPSSLASLPLPLSHMGLYHQSHFSSTQRMGGLHPSPASTPSSQLSVGGANLPSNLSTQGGRSPLEQEDLRCFSPLRN